MRPPEGIPLPPERIATPPEAIATPPEGIPLPPEGIATPPQGGSAVMRFWVPYLPLARIAWLRHIIYPFVIVDALFFVTDPIPHGDVPASIYRPLLVREYLHLPQPSHVYVRVLFVVLIVSAVVAATGRLPRLAGWVCAVAMLDWVSNAMSYSKIDHDHFALMLTLFILPTVRPARVSDTERDQGAGWVIRLIQMAVVLSYFLSAWAKMRFGGWGWANGATLIWALTRRGQGIAAWLGGQPGLTHAMQWVVLVMESCSPLMLWLRGRPLAAYLLFWLGFHASTYVLLTIHFLPLAVCLSAFVPMERLVRPRRDWFRRQAGRVGQPTGRFSHVARRRRGGSAHPQAASEAPSSAR